MRRLVSWPRLPLCEWSDERLSGPEGERSVHTFWRWTLRLCSILDLRLLLFSPYRPRLFGWLLRLSEKAVSDLSLGRQKTRDGTFALPAAFLLFSPACFLGMLIVLSKAAYSICSLRSITHTPPSPLKKMPASSKIALKLLGL